MSDGSGAAFNCTLSLILGVTVADIGFTWVAAVNPGTPVGDLDVYVDGQAIPRRVVGVTQDSWYVEDTVITGRIIFWANLGAAPLSIDIRRKAGTVDTSTTNTGRISLSSGLVVGSAAQVSGGLADYSTLSSAITAATTGGKISILPGVSSTESIVLNKRLTIVGVGYDSKIIGTFTLTAACSFASVRGLYVTQFIFQAGAAGNQVVDGFWDVAPTDPNPVGTNRLTGMSTV
jgi:hypothetical protein